MLLDLPPEVLNLIFDHHVHETGIRRSAHLRLVCRAFDQYVLRAIYALRTFENVDDDSPDHLTWNSRMSKPMVAGLIRSKLHNHQEERVLTREILTTVRYIVKVLGDAEEQAYKNALVSLAAASLPLYEIVRGLSRDRGPMSTDGPAEFLESALAAAVFLGQRSHIQILVDLEAKAQYRTKWFGDALLGAASSLRSSTFYSILRTALTTDDHLMKQLTAARLVMALEHAALHGRADIFCADLWPWINETYEHRLVHKVFEPAIKSAALAGHDNVVIEIFNLLEYYTRDSLTAFEDEFWIETLRLSASNGLLRVAQLILSNTGIAQVKSSLNLPLEDACRKGHLAIVELLLAHRTENNLDWLDGSLYWAARESHHDILRVIVQSIAQLDASCLGNALCGASINGAAGMSKVLEVTTDWAYVKHILDLEGKTFAQVMDFVCETGIIHEPEPRRCSPMIQQSSVPLTENDPFRALGLDKRLERDEAYREGDFKVVHNIISQELYADGRCPKRGFSQAIAHQHPGILQYLCEKFPGRRHFTVDAAADSRSTAIFQVLLNHGWTVDVAASRMEPPLLGIMSQSEELLRWFLDHGGSANYRDGWDATPFSIAVSRKSLGSIGLMLQSGADTRLGQSLHFAVHRPSLDRLATMDLLIAFGASLDARWYENHSASWIENKLFGVGTPIHKASELGHLDAVAYLLWRGARWGLLDSRGRTVLDVAREGDCGKIVEIIKDQSTRTQLVHSQ